MKLSKKIKTLAAVTVLAIGIPAAGIAYASPGQFMNTTPAATQQMNQNAGPAAGTAQQLKMTPGVNNPMTQNATSAPADNSNAQATTPMVSISPTAPNSAQMPRINTNQMTPGQMNYSQMNANHQAMTQVHQSTNMGPGAGHSAMNGSMGQGHAQGGMGMGR